MHSTHGSARITHPVIHARLVTITMASESELQDWRGDALKMEAAVAQAVVGQKETIHLINVALYARGHVLLEGGVGVGKTTLLRAFARATGGDFERIEGTIDLMPGDLIYHTFVDADGRPRIDPGPLLRHGENLTTFFFNEINRSRPQVQSLLLRAMAERTVSAFGRDYRFPHLTVFADRNKVEKDETFELASAARDRFLFELNMPTPSSADVRRALVFDPVFHDADALMQAVPAAVIDAARLNEIGAAIQRGVSLSPSIEKYVLDIWQATETPQRFGIEIDDVDMERLILAGASPRGMSALVRAVRANAWLDGRLHALPEDVHAVLLPALGHRVFFTPVYEMRRHEIAEALIATMVQKIAVP
ncbi:ATPase family associated with various cellular activities (AAA) [Caballeronia pedi]|uniref:ATPase family associated with various cellular activities (AAA) n=2 Tax=Caballeronia pedi TaxID=1777141 RepID=A0A157ZG63_9BURK|nr:ATPase family associated with various cellular activities (AAA) [Caballeronia pedi]